MRILLCGEGVHEVGDPRVWDARSKAHVSVEGWMQALTRKLRAEPLEFEIRRRRDLQLLRPLRPALAGHAEKARLARFIAQNEQFDAVIFMADADSNHVRRWREVVSEIRAGFDDLDGRVTIAAVPCVPMSASESWLLADYGPWANIGLASPDSLPPQPETIWGARDDPEDDHPHRFFARVCAAAEMSDSRDTRNQIASGIDPTALGRACPTSFPPFAQSIASLQPKRAIYGPSEP